MYGTLESHVRFPYFATFWLEPMQIVEKGNLLKICTTATPAPFEYNEDNNSFYQLRRPTMDCIGLEPTGNISYEPNNYLRFPFNFLQQLIKIVDTNERIDLYEIYETYEVKEIGWEKSLEKDMQSMEDIVNSTPKKVGPPILEPLAPQKPNKFKRRIINVECPRKRLKFDFVSLNTPDTVSSNTADSTDGHDEDIDMTPLLEEIPDDEPIKFSDLSEEARKILEQLSFKVVETQEIKKTGIQIVLCVVYPLQLTCNKIII